MTHTSDTTTSDRRPASTASPAPVEGPAAARPTGLVRVDPAWEDEILAFLKAGYPHRRQSTLLARWKWMFVESARRLGREPLVWGYRKPEGLLAHQGVIPVDMQIDGERIATGWFVETMVLQTNRAGTIGPGVISKTKNDLPFNLSLGQTPLMRSIQFKLGWIQVAPLETLLLPLRPRQVLQGKLGSGWARAAAVPGLWLKDRWHRLKVRPRRALTVRQVDRFGAEHDALWARVERDYPCSVVLDAGYLNWKFVDQPGQEFERLELRQGNQVVAVVVLKKLPPRGDYQYLRLAVVTVVAPAYDAPVFWAALEAARQAGRRCGAGALVWYVINRQLVRQSLEFGFLRRDPTRVFLICPEGLADERRLRVMDADQWLVTLGDSDVDRPEQGDDEPPI